MASARRIQRLLPVSLALALAACGGGGGGSAGPPNEVAASLAALGVDTTVTPRVANQSTQEPLPDSYAPFGAARTFDKLDEIAFIGVRLDPAAFGGDGLFTILEEQQSPTLPGVFTTERLHAPSAASTPWALSAGAAPASLRAAAAGDFDGDGLEETLILAREGGDTAVRLWSVQDRLASFSTGARVFVSDAEPTSLALATGDFDGDGRADVVAAVVTATDVRLVFLESGSGVLEPSGRTIVLTPVAPAAVLDVTMATGNLDHDPADELAVVLNEAFGSGASESGTSRYFVYDDASTAFAQRAARAVSAAAGGATRAALAAGVAIGDVDGDNVGEVVLGGLTNFDPSGTCQYAYLLFALDDLPHDLASLGARYETSLFPPGSACASLRLRVAHVKTLDRDGDGADEIQVNQLSFEDFRVAQPWTPLGEALPLRQLFGGSGSTYSGEFSRVTAAFAAGDVTADKKADLVFYAQGAADGNAVQVWATSIDPVPGSPTQGQEIWRRTVAIPTAAAPGEPARPLLVNANVDRDSLAIQYSAAERRVVFTEPVVIAALAAAPCATDLGQNLDACRTAFGTAKSTQVETELTFTMSAGILVGGEINDFGAGFEVEAVVKATWGLKTNASYTLTKRVVRTTGPLEDAVIFTSIPYDQFTYTILSHPDPDLIGASVVVSLPRSPIETMVERRFFNANVPAGSVQIGSDVFQHVIGSPRSYPTAAQKDQLLAARPELFNGPLDVGQGGGSTAAEINVARALAAGVSYGVEATFQAKTTVAAVSVGLTVGAGVEASLQITRGTESYYSGSVSNIAADRYNPSTAYKFGLFSYIHDGPVQSFEVVNYWVE